MGSAPVPHRFRTGSAAVPQRIRTGTPRKQPGRRKKTWVFPPVFFGVFVLLGVFLCHVFLGVFLPEDAAPHIRRRSAHDPHCAPHLLRTCSALAPHLLRTCAALVPHLCRTCAALVPHLCRTPHCGRICGAASSATVLELHCAASLGLRQG